MQGGRPKAREIFCRVLYEVEISGEDPIEVLEYALGRYHLTEDAREHVLRIAEAWDRNRDETDAAIESRLQSWSLDRLSIMVLSVLRLGATELAYVAETPTEVVLDQSIRLAQRYGEDGADAFVNGVLDRLARDFGRTVRDGDSESRDRASLGRNAEGGSES